MLLGLDSGLKVGLFFAYIVAWSAQGVLVHRANKESGTQFDPGSVIAAQEILKLCISLVLGGIRDFLPSHLSLLFWYMIPAGLYAIYNNLTFKSLEIFDPTTYFVLMQFRIVVTGLFSVLLLRRRIDSLQWLALVVIMVGAMFKEISRCSLLIHNLRGYGIIGIQILLSVSAGVVNEKYLKQNTNCPITVQNAFMYLNSLALLFSYQSAATRRVTLDSLITAVKNPYLSPVVINAGLIGVLTSYFLKYLSSVHKSIASAIELWLTAFLSSLVFGYGIDHSTGIGIFIVTFGVALYSFSAAARDPRIAS